MFARNMRIAVVCALAAFGATVAAPPAHAASRFRTLAGKVGSLFLVKTTTHSATPPRTTVINTGSEQSWTSVSTSSSKTTWRFGRQAAPAAAGVVCGGSSAVLAALAGAPTASAIVAGGIAGPIAWGIWNLMRR